MTESNRSTVQAYLDQLDREKLHEEVEAFWAMQADLVARYLGEFVAVHQGQVVDHDPDVVLLEQRIVERTKSLELAHQQLRERNEELHRANEELKELDRLKSEFVSMVSHALRLTESRSSSRALSNLSV